MKPTRQSQRRPHPRTRIRPTLHRLAAMLGAVVLLTGIGIGTASLAQAAGTGQITGYQGLCLDDRSASTAQYNPVQVYTCNGSGAQQWTVASNGSLQVLGMCLDVYAAGTANGTKVDLYSCNGTAAQVWQPQSNGALLNPNSGKCLDDTGWGGAGTQVQIWDCAGSANQSWTLPNGSGGGGGTGGFVVSQAQFNQMFPNRNSFYTYSGLVAALSAYPAFATTGSATVQKQEAAAFLANVDHETGGLVYINEIDQSGNYCASESYGCPAGTYAYYGRGPLQLSWNFNYYAAGNALGIDLLHNPNLVATDSATSWKTAIWYWFTGTGNGSLTSHQAMTTGAGFGATIRAINDIECNGGNTGEMQDRVNDYESFTSILGVTAGGNLTC
ncbi:glycoside hydrolase family 19 [Catenulispora acidiphila DSM 44928]|uniref:Glycoside hydrolase family 19 n=1 Tax=Catenulispora acidiphila (strain DSM 44928 / JCM 14897 / NBRC 102108 / NRRL B-24433 / ID139908) TaxID=479433 RepID=C7PZK0_CATAD|nr:glycoside hydrolase family 19 protein [Catenulispora acidiphila]ACU73515.1 glycoside hydrolase family 19 [Catenulispora acidiphila DSM 44928]